MGHRRGIGDDLAALLAEDLEAAERDRSGREEVAVGQDDAVAAADGVRPGIARHGAAALGEARGDALEGQGAGHREGRQIRARKQHRKIPQKQHPLLALERCEHGKDDARNEQHRQQRVLPAGIRVARAGGVGKARRKARALGSAPRRHRDDIGRVADGRNTEGIIQPVQALRFAQQRAVEREHRDGGQRRGQRRARGQKGVERCVGKRHNAQNKCQKR